MGKGPRIPADLVRPRAEEIHRLLSSLAPATICGSLRRGDRTVGDIDIVLSGDVKDEAVVDLLRQNYDMTVLSDGSKGPRRCYQISGLFSHFPMNLDVWIVPPEKIGSALLYCTGPGVFNTIMRRYAHFKNMKLRLLGIVDPAGNQLPVLTEEECFAAIGWSYLEPRDRSNWFLHLDPYLDEMEKDEHA